MLMSAGPCIPLSSIKSRSFKTDDYSMIRNEDYLFPVFCLGTVQIKQGVAALRSCCELPVIDRRPKIKKMGERDRHWPMQDDLSIFDWTQIRNESGNQYAEKMYS